MMLTEPIINVGIIEGASETRGELLEKFKLIDDVVVFGKFYAKAANGEVVLYGGKEIELIRGREVHFIPLNGGKFLLNNVRFGISFHWEQMENQTFEGALQLVARSDGTIVVINQIPLEKYLASVISSEMSATAPMEFLKAQAITSRSWLAAMLSRKQQHSTLGIPSERSFQIERELIIRWYDREDHNIFDVCADDHCQRYQGVSKIISGAVQQAIDETRGLFLVYNNQICDARFHKACGGLTEQYRNAWEEREVSYLSTVPCSTSELSLTSEQEAEEWILSFPAVYCNPTEKNILKQILPSFDQETADFFRWKVEYVQQELSELIYKKSGIDFGEIQDLIPIQRGSSGRIVKLKIVGSKNTLVVGKELEIRKWLSPSHLYSSAFIVKKESGKFILRGAGWGHGVGLCQIGAAVMATKGWKAEDILRHYFKNAELKKLY